MPARAPSVECGTTATQRSHCIASQNEPASVDIAMSGEIETLIERERPDCIVLHGKLLEAALTDFFACLRKRTDLGSLRAIVMSAPGEGGLRICLLSFGASAIAVKPVVWSRLLKGDSEEPSIMRIGEIELDWEARRVRRGSRKVRLSETELRLLKFFMDHPERVLSRTEIMAGVWGLTCSPFSLQSQVESVLDLVFRAILLFGPCGAILPSRPLVLQAVARRGSQGRAQRAEGLSLTAPSTAAR